MDRKPQNTIHPRLLKILSHLYERVETLEQFIKAIPETDKLEVIRPNDKDKYIENLQSTLVCTLKGSRTTPQNILFQQFSHQSEVVLRVVEKIRRREGRGTNLLTIGYNLMSDDRNAQISSSRNIEYSCPNQNTSRLQYGSWKTLLERVGDGVMEFLLETKAIFVPAASTCYMQISGIPLYDLWPFKKSWAMSWKVRPSLKRLQTSLLNNSKQHKRRVKRKYKMPANKVQEQGLLGNKSLVVDNVIHTSMVSIKSDSEGSGHPKRSHTNLRPSDEYPNSSFGISKDFCTNNAINSTEPDSEMTNIRYKEKKRKRTDGDEDHPLKHLKCDIDFQIGLSSHNKSDPEISVITYMHQSYGTMFSDSYVSACETLRTQSSFIENSVSKKNVTYEKLTSECCDLENSEIFVSCRSAIDSTDNCTSFCRSTTVFQQKQIVSSTESLTNVVQKADEPCIDSLSKSADMSINIESPTGHEILSPFLQDNSSGKTLTNTSIGKQILDISASGKQNLKSNFEMNCREPLKTYTDYDTLISKMGHIAETVQKKRRLRKKNPRKINENSPSQAYSKTMLFDRAKILYSKDLTENFPPRYVFPEISPDETGANVLLMRILSKNVVVAADGCQMTDYPDEMKSKLVAILCSLLKNHQVCRYKYLLRYNSEVDFITQLKQNGRDMKSLHGHSNSCNLVKTKAVQPLQHLAAPVYIRGAAASTNTKTSSLSEKPLSSISEKAYSSFIQSSELSYTKLLEKHVSHRNVFLFIRACIVRVIPPELFGSNQNKNVFLKKVQKFISFGRYERFSLGQVMKNMKVKCPWLADIRSNSNRLQLLAKVLFWLMESYVMPLLQSYFYITDTSIYRNRLFYYRKFAWNKIHRKGVSDYLKRGILRPLTEAECKQMLSSRQSLGVAFLRFLPKSAALRPIVNMCKKQTIGARESTINRQLQDLLQVLTYEKDQNPGCLGSSKFSLNDIYDSWKHFVLDRRERGDERQLYFVKVDIKNCYDSIVQNRLYSIMHKVLQMSKEYVIRRYVGVIASGGKLKRTFHREACSLVNFRPSFQQHVAKTAKERGIQKTIFIDQVIHMQEKTESLIAKLHSHLFGNIVKIGKKFYLQTSGIGQGSVISTMLCNYYYGEMESEYLTVGKEDLLMRQTDDFLFITPHKDSAVAFLELMMNGIASYNCYINHEKTLINFNYFDASVRCLADGDLFPWCGLLIDIHKLDIRADYGRYTNLSIRDTISIDITEHAGLAMRNKLMFSMRSKCHSIFLDMQINCLEVVIENIFKLFLLTAFKFHCYASELPLSGSTSKNPVFFVDMIYELSNFMHSMMTKNSTNSVLQSSTTLWICFQAFTLKLSQHQSAYQDILKILKTKCRTLQRLIEAWLLSCLLQIVSNTMPVEFKCIRSL